MRLTLAISALFSATAAAAHEIEFLYEQELGGGYSQSWSAISLDSTAVDGHEIYIRGDGKLGEFVGFLFVDCRNPRFSRWLAHGGVLDKDSVPAEVIDMIRTREC